MISIKDIVILKNHATRLVIPFFSAAYIADNTLNIFHDPMFDWATNLSKPLYQVAGFVIWVFAVVVLIAVILIFLFDKLIVKLDSMTGEKFVMAWMGATSLTVGILGFCYFLPKMTAPLNFFWHLGFLTYGFSLMKRDLE